MVESYLTGESSGVSHRYIRLKSDSQDAVPYGPETVHMTAYARFLSRRFSRFSRLAGGGYATRAYTRHNR